MRDDSALLAAWGDGDRDAGRELLERHFEPIFRFFRNKADSDLEDLVQTTFLHALESRAAFRGDASFRTYLFTIARHELYAYWRRKQRRDDEADVGDLSVEDLAPSPRSEVAERRERALLARALRAIPLDLQIALELHYWEDLTGPELAAVLEVPEGTVRTRLRRGRELLEEKMAALAAGDDVLLRSTVDGFDSWAASLKAQMAR
jgi:RNA polymerase sigma factor (sigma-70 family)